MSDELRTEWTCWMVPHDGEGPGRFEPRRVRERRWVGVGKALRHEIVAISAVEAAEHFAFVYFDELDEEWGFEDGGGMFVGVEIDAERAIAFRVTKRVKIDAEARLASEITPEALRPLPPRPVTEDDAA